MVVLQAKQAGQTVTQVQVVEGGTQSAGGAAGTGTSAPASAGTKYQGGQALGNSYGGGGGGGWYGGGGGAYTNGNAMGGGGGGSSYTGGTGISSASTTAANGTTPGNTSDIDWGRSGTGGSASTNGEPGKVIITPSYGTSLTCTSDTKAEVLVVAGGGGGGCQHGWVVVEAEVFSIRKPILLRPTLQFQLPLATAVLEHRQVLLTPLILWFQEPTEATQSLVLSQLSGEAPVALHTTLLAVA